MPQNPSTHQTVVAGSPNLQDASYVNHEAVDAADLAVADDANVFSVEAYADRLMDELFEEIDHSLEHGTELPLEPAQPEFVALQPVSVPVSVPSVPKLALPSTLAPRPTATIEPAGDKELAELSVEALAEAEQRRSTGTSFDGLLLLVACLSLIATGAVWFVLQSRLQLQTATSPAAPSLVASRQAQVDDPFLTYMQRSLERIEREANASRQAAAQLPPPPSTNLPAAAPSPAPASSPGATVLERVYIPVYQPPLFNLPGGPAQPAPPGAVAPAQVPVLPTSPSAATSAPSAAAPAPAPVAAATGDHVLIGVLELGDRSAALFEVGGTPQRIGVGESIGSSGWTLVSVENQEAIIRRNGEVRSIYVGQQF